MKNVMVNAWEIARKGAAKFGGKVKEYFVEALKMAWAIVKGVETKGGKVDLVIAAGSRKWPTSVKTVDGQNVAPVEENLLEKTFKLANGIYEVAKVGYVIFVKVENGGITEIEESEATGLPELQGSEKQIAWARKIRAEFIAKMERLFNGERNHGEPARVAEITKAKAGYAKALESRLSASYWIDNRNNFTKLIVQNV